MSFVAAGELRLDATGEVMAPDLLSSVLDGLLVRALGSVHAGRDGSVFSVRTQVMGRTAFLAATFEGETLKTVELVLVDGSGSDGLADQAGLKQEHERWLAAQGLALEPMPYILDGVQIMPAAHGPEHPRHVVTAWGEVVSLIDPKNGGASVVIRYAHPR